MNAIVQTGYGSADVMKLKQVEKPTPGDCEVLVRVLAASLAAGDYFGMRGKPFPVRMYIGFPKPKPDFIVGLDFAGVVEAVGKDVTRFQPGDAATNSESLLALGELIEAGKVTAVIDRTFGWPMFLRPSGIWTKVTPRARSSSP